MSATQVNPICVNCFCEIAPTEWSTTDPNGFISHADNDICLANRAEFDTQMMYGAKYYPDNSLVGLR